ncbi:MAG: hypothetical protein Q8M09_02265 [Pseudomonadota bacterium]|nr:hypothetical protein [Pseudomonadota bacterium]MDP1903067.1 hypothetical protein [Pseudomonadota bacterium]MDP2353056.1 hypothetical protein [Pseudomonadota bacterium]
MSKRSTVGIGDQEEWVSAKLIAKVAAAAEHAGDKIMKALERGLAVSGVTRRSLSTPATRLPNDAKARRDGQIQIIRNIDAGNFPETSAADLPGQATVVRMQQISNILIFLVFSKRKPHETETDHRCTRTGGHPRSGRHGYH